MIEKHNPLHAGVNVQIGNLDFYKGESVKERIKTKKEGPHHSSYNFCLFPLTSAEDSAHGFSREASIFASVDPAGSLFWF